MEKRPASSRSHTAPHPKRVKTLLLLPLVTVAPVYHTGLDLACPGLAWLSLIHHHKPQGWNISVAHSSSPNSSFLRHEAFCSCSNCGLPGSREFLFLEKCIIILLIIFVICRFSSSNRVVIVKLPNNSITGNASSRSYPGPKTPQQHQQGLKELEATCLDQGSPAGSGSGHSPWPWHAHQPNIHPPPFFCIVQVSVCQSVQVNRHSRVVLSSHAFATGANTHRATDIVHVNTCHMSCSLTTVMRLSQAC